MVIDDADGMAQEFGFTPPSPAAQFCQFSVAGLFKKGDATLDI